MLSIKTMIIGFFATALSHTHAMQILDEDKLSTVVAQDGITLSVDTNVSIDRMIWVDNDGLQPINGGTFSVITPQKGLVVFGDTQNPLKIYGGRTVVKIDADGGSADTPVLNIEIDLPDNLTIETGAMYVAGRNVANSVQNPTKVMENMKIHLNDLKMNIQLGTSPQGDLAKVYGTVNNGIRVENVGILNANGSNVMSMDEFKVTDAGNANTFTFNGTGVNVTPVGIIITPSSGKMLDVSMSNLRLGNSASTGMGEMFISGLNIGNNMVIIGGH